jgi:hypothetical protein
VRKVGRRLQIVPIARRIDIMTHAINLFRRLFVAATLVSSYAVDGNSVTATPSEFMPLEPEDQAIVQKLIDEFSLPFGIDSARLRKFIINDGFEIIAVRDDNGDCLGDRCITALFTAVQQNVELVVLGLLSGRVSLYDSADQFCQGCDFYYSLIFEGIDGYVTVSLAPGYVVWIEEEGVSK